LIINNEVRKVSIVLAVFILKSNYCLKSREVIVRIHIGIKFLSSRKCPDRSCRPIRVLFIEYRWHFPGDVAAWRVAHHSSPGIAEVTYSWGHTFTPY